jgi:hypothetical protein
MSLNNANASGSSAPSSPRAKAAKAMASNPETPSESAAANDISEVAGSGQQMALADNGESSQPGASGPPSISTPQGTVKRAYTSSTITPQSDAAFGVVPTKRTKSSRAAAASSASKAAAHSLPAFASHSREALLAKFPPPDVDLTVMGGMAKPLEELFSHVIFPLQHPEVYQHLQTNPTRGILLHGVPGGGKTRLVNCLAGHFKIPLIPISAPSLVSSLSGDTEKLLRQTFEDAKALAPCILFLDEVDAITPKRETAQREMEKRIVGQLLTCMDGEFSRSPFFLWFY